MPACQWSEEENALKCVRCRVPTRPFNLCCDDCEAVAYCGDACKRADADAHARACKGLAAARFADNLGDAEKGIVVAMSNVGNVGRGGRQVVPARGRQGRR